MNTTEEEQIATSEIDKAYEFTASQWFDFLNGETKRDKQRSELWFESGLSYAPSPSIPRIKARRSFKVESMCSFNEEEEQVLKAIESSDECSFKASDDKNENNLKNTDVRKQDSFLDDIDNKENIPPSQTGVYTPKPLMTNGLKHHQTATKNRSVLMPIKPLQSYQAKGNNQSIIKRETKVKNIPGTSNLVQENQAIKRQKLDDGGKSGQVYVLEQITPFVSTGELMKKFQTSTRDLSLSQNQPKSMTLTRPKEPKLLTSQRVRSVRLKSTSELEEEMLAKMPKFKARPLNKKILAAPALPAPQRSTPSPPEFQEFHLVTMARASQHAETSSVVSTEMSKHNDWMPPLTTEPKSPLLQTTLRARPSNTKTSTEIEQEELQKVPKFRARPLNKKIFESKGEMGIFFNTKKHVTIPQEFHFVTDERISRPNSVIDLFDKLSLKSDSCREKPLQRNTTPSPFLLRTEERGADKEKKLRREVTNKQIEEKRVRIRKATPYPYTTDYPVVPPKPEPKQCTKPIPFQLESLAMHEEEMRREMEERIQMEREEAQRRVFRAQPVMKEDPTPVPEKVRKTLTEIQEFNLHVDHRAVERADFDHKIKEKEMMYKRYREETEAAKMVEEERALKQLRRTMVPHARPVPNFNNPFLLKKSNKETTKPKSPKRRVIRRIERRTMMMASTQMK